MIPILGQPTQPAQLLAGYPTAVLRCTCDPSLDLKATTVIIVGVGSQGACPTCGRVFTIIGPAKVQLGLVTEAPEGLAV